MNDSIEEGPCALCRRWCGKDDYCWGCREFICKYHNFAPWGAHAVDDHDYEESEDDLDEE